MLTHEQIKELRALCAAASPGPWQWSIHTVCEGGGFVGAGPVHPAKDSKFYNPDVPSREFEDALFIAESRTALPLLLDEVEKLHTELFKYQEIAQRTIRENKRLKYALGDILKSASDKLKMILIAEKALNDAP